MFNSRKQPVFTGGRFARYSGLFHDESAPDSAWIRDRATIWVRHLQEVDALCIRGHFRPHPEPDLTTRGGIGLVTRAERRVVARLKNPSGEFNIQVPLSSTPGGRGTRVEIQLTGVGLGNFLAWMGRLTEKWPLPQGLRRLLQTARRQNRNRQLRITAVEAGNERLFDFSNRHSAYNPQFGRRHLNLGLNIVGFFRADLGIGESARCMVRAADAAGFPTALVNLKLNCKASQTDRSLIGRLQEENPYPINVFHLDAPQSRDIDHHHGPAFRRDKLNVGYWAWELPDFPDSWLPYCDPFDEIWCPSEFVRESIAFKVPLPVLAMPHAIEFPLPKGDQRARFGLPPDRFLFLFVYDLNSYQARKNPQAVVEAFRRAFPRDEHAGLVIKVQSVRGNEADFAQLQENVAGLPGTTLISETLSRAEIYALQSCCDCFVSLHRAEGFGLSLAECMYQGKPVISTDWSATAEFLNAENGCPVRCRLVTLDRNHGPYSKGQTWADPDTDHAAWWMRELLMQPELRARLGTRAAETIRSRFSPTAIGGRYRRRLEAMAGW